MARLPCGRRRNHDEISAYAADPSVSMAAGVRPCRGYAGDTSGPLKAAEAANDRWLQFDDQFIATPAHTLEDIGMKLDFLTVIADMKDGPNADVSDRMVFSLIRDIERMTDTKILR